MTSTGLPVTFAPWVQPRAAAGLGLDDANTNPGAPAAPPAPQPLRLGVVVANSTPDADGKVEPPQSVDAPHTDVRMLGPAGVVGVDPAQIVRRFPAPGTGLRTDTTNMACIEFAATDLPWRFTPATAIASGADAAKLRPWLVLIVVDAAIPLTPVPGGPCPLITVPIEQLPDLKQSWAWAHVQLDGGLGAAGAGRARLLCPRKPPDQSLLRAVLVPAFHGGVLAAAADPDTRSNALSRNDVHQPAWDVGQPGQVTLPVYDEWTFATGGSKDFEALARLLAPVSGAAGAALGGRSIDIGHPFPARDASEPTRVVTMPGALVPVTTASADPPATAAAVTACAAEIADAINTAASLQQMGPPLRGGPQAGRTPPVARTGGDWVDEANRDPRNRLAAAQGADWVNAHQEDLMADAWTQAGEIRAAAQRLAVARVAAAATDSLHQRHVLPLTVDEQITLTAPAVARLRVQAAGAIAGATAPSLAQLLDTSAAPNGLASTTCARLRTRALMPRAASAALTSKAIAGQFVGFPAVRTAAPKPPLTTVPTATPPAVTPALRLLVDAVNQTAAQTRFQTHQLTVSTMATTLSPLHLTAKVVQLTGPDTGASVVAVPAATTTTLWLNAFTPAASVRLRVQSMIVGTVKPTVGPVHPNFTAATAALQPVLPTPRVGAPLALGLIERDPSWLVSGVDQFPLDRVALLQPNKAFIESLMLGANHAMLDKYLWRGFPTDRRGTPIRQFWPTGSDDILPIAEWPAKTDLGSHLAGQGQSGDLAFLLIRSQLFERYPETIIAAAKPTSTGAPAPDLSIAGVIPPAMPMISIDSRTRIIGYPISHTAISTLPGCYFLLLEPPTGPRFGMETDQWPKTSTRNCLDALASTGVPVTPVNSSAELASRTLRQTVRVIIHSTRLVSTQ